MRVVISHTIALLFNADGPTVHAFPDYTYANLVLTAWMMFIPHGIPAKTTFRLSQERWSICPLIRTHVNTRWLPCTINNTYPHPFRYWLPPPTVTTILPQFSHPQTKTGASINASDLSSGDTRYSRVTSTKFPSFCVKKIQGWASQTLRSPYLSHVTAAAT
jgi:hypothetical protein